MKCSKFGLMLLALIITTPASARDGDGSFTGNGADRKGPGHGAAWFLGERTVHWCGNSEAITPALESAANKWASYIEKKRVYDSLKAPQPFALRFEKQSTCAGADLAIELSADAKADVLSGSELLEQDLARGWGKGKIWLNEKVLAQPGALETQLLHQLGHILGNDHVGGTIMAEEIANIGNRIPVQPAIDGARELYLCLSCSVAWRSAEGRIYREENGAAAVLGSSAVPLRFTAELPTTNYGDAKLFSVAFNGRQSYLRSQSTVRLGLLEIDGASQQVIVRRNFDKLVEIDRLVNGRPERFFEVKGQ